ncbi:D-alanyl-D-alanine carboxypeptidase family protein [Streptomyces sp. NPDC050161]|uniref:D-alanyl-D-alanine carboxypeptidase family protein n=1 Tax=Streptomyces sp. NPDC050161 TaxID=3365604 RepID=UPI00379347C3
MSSASWPSVKAGTAAVVCAACLVVTCPPATAGSSGTDDEPGSGASGSGTRLDRSGVQFRSGVSDPPSVSALSWMVTDADDGRILAAKNAHRELPPASTLKTLFAVTVLPKFGQGSVHTVSEDDLSGINAGSSLVGVKEDMSYSVADLWRGVFLSSGSDAVHTLASMNGGWQETVSDMQEMAHRLGARDTTVESADGFDTPGQVSSAYDLTLFAKAGLTNRDFARFAATKEAQFPETGGPDSFGIQNTNRLLVGSHGVTPYPGLVGVKNGYTSKAGNTLVAAAQQDGRTLLVTVMNPQSGQYNAVYEEARALLDWGFSAEPDASPVAMLPDKVGSAMASVSRTDGDDRDQDQDKDQGHEQNRNQDQDRDRARSDDRARGHDHKQPAGERSGVVHVSTVGRGDKGGTAPWGWWFAVIGAALLTGLGAELWRSRRRG